MSWEAHQIRVLENVRYLDKGAVYRQAKNRVILSSRGLGNPGRDAVFDGSVML